MVDLYANENFPLPVVEKLRRLGHNVLTIQETSKAGQSMSDAEVLSNASADGRVVLTLNRKHFINLHNINSKHEGIIVCTFDPDFISQAERIHETIESEAHISGHLIRVNRPAT